MNKVKLFFVIYFLFCLLNKTNSQFKNNVFVNINYGLNGNFFVRSYDEVSGPVDKQYFYKKDFLGTIAGISLQYYFGKKTYVNVGYNRSINTGKKNYEGIINATNIYIRDFKLRHINNFYELGVGRNVHKKGSLRAELGLVLLYDLKQTIAIENWDNYIAIDESNFKNANSVEGGFYFALNYRVKLDTKFDVGLQTKLYYLASVNEIEAFSFAPTLTYRFN
ncbi:MAG: hypothetical protein ACOVNY_11585 [Chitinophagaceae bacterium]